MARPAKSNVEETVVSNSKRTRDALSTIARSFGAGSIRVLSDTEALDVPVYSTGSPGLDCALGAGGIPRGRVVEIFGAESSGKTTLSLCMAAQAQKAGAQVAFVDVEHSLNPEWASVLGVDLEQLLFCQPDSAEEALELVEGLMREAKVEFIIVDSVAALVPQAEVEGEMGDNHVGLQARLMGRALRKFTPVLKTAGTTVVFINQTRMKIGVTFGSPETTSGGKALKFYASLRLRIKKIGTLKKGEDAIGNRIRIDVVKNKIAAPHRRVELDLSYDYGLDRMAELIDTGERFGLIAKSGAWLSYGEHRLGQGKPNACDHLRANPDLATRLESQVKQKLQEEQANRYRRRPPTRLPTQPLPEANPKPTPKKKTKKQKEAA